MAVATHFGDVHRHFGWHAQHFRGVVLRVLCESHCQACVKWCRGSALHTPHFTLYTFHSTLLRLTLRTPNSIFPTLHPTFYTLPFTPRIPRWTLSTPHFSFYTFTLYIFHSELQTSHSTLYTFHSTLYTSHSTLDTPPFNTSHSRLCTQNCTLHTLHTTLYTLHSTYFTRHSTPHTIHSTL